MLAFRRGCLVPHPLILLGPGQQFPPQFFIHPAIPPHPAAWLLAQHADRDLDLQRAFLDALRGAVAEGEASPANLAYLEDRVRVADERPQLYGTQFTVTDGDFVPCPIEDPQRLDERRAAAGLEPFAVYEAQIKSLRAD